MKKNLMFLALAAIGLASCNGGFKKGNGGMLYDIHVDKGATRIKEGDFISLQLIAKTDGDSVLMSTYERDAQSLPFFKKPKLQATFLPALNYWVKAIARLSKPTSTRL